MLQIHVERRGSDHLALILFLLLNQGQNVLHLGIGLFRFMPQSYGINCLLTSETVLLKNSKAFCFRMHISNNCMFCAFSALEHLFMILTLYI
jgi:hypothetical protein